MPATELKELLKHELGDMHYAEQKILRMLGTMNRESSNPKMKERLEEHLTETYEQIERLKRAFEVIGEEAVAEKCHAAIGLKEEHDSFVREEQPSPPMLEAFDLGNGLRVEHYEIAGYRSAIALAQALGENECVALLTESLREEEAMATFIERSASRALKLISATMDEGEEEEEGPRRGRSSGAGTAGRTAAKSGARGGAKAADTGAKSASKSASGKGGASKSASKTANKSASKTASKSASKSASGGAKSGSARKTAARSGGRGKG
ncbi:MAG: DNA topoisomerase I [uncultured Gemmatimonadetes bacterium]|uniref:DNA topoisomerase I n=1 Tax=uncultured Gemmatimonadota bacterium TaxID=203437 RepID=A0A6J4K4U7_9BACT|nr:MAG: DNA topoisomerase I [uncultured Gemmatimonadota bacterium]